MIGQMKKIVQYAKKVQRNAQMAKDAFRNHFFVMESIAVVIGQMKKIVYHARMVLRNALHTQYALENRGFVMDMMTARTDLMRTIANQN